MSNDGGPNWLGLTFGGACILVFSIAVVGIALRLFDIGWAYLAVPVFLIASYLIGRLAWWLMRRGQ